MSRTCASSMNKQWVGNPAQWVFCGRGARAGLEIAERRGPLSGRGASIFAGQAAAGDQAGTGRAVPASITVNQALSAGGGAAVAIDPSQRVAGSAQFRRFWPCRLLIANLWTAAADRVRGPAGGPSRRQNGAGGATPSAARAASNIPSRRPCRDLAKSARSRLPSPASDRAAAPPGAGFRFGTGREFPNRKPGSGVRECVSRAVLTGKSAGFQALAGAQGGAIAVMECVPGGHASLDLRGNGQMATGRG